MFRLLLAKYENWSFIFLNVSRAGLRFYISVFNLFISKWNDNFLKVFVHSMSDWEGDTSCEDFSLSFDQSHCIDNSQITSTSETNYTIVLKIIAIFLKFLFIRRRNATVTSNVKIFRRVSINVKALTIVKLHRLAKPITHCWSLTKIGFFDK